MSIADSYEDRGWRERFEKGWAEGFRIGLAEGIRMGTRNVLLRMLRSRFGALPETAEARIQAAEVAQLEVWADRILTAATLDEVLLES